MEPISQSTAQPLRTAKRAFTRQRLCDAARITFYERGFSQSTMEEIAAAAGARRSTLYTYFRDKDAILAALADDYALELCAVMAQLPGPVPSRAEIDMWVGHVATFVARERTPTILLIDFGSVLDIPPSVEKLGQSLLRALAAQLPAFRRALEPGPMQGLARARAAVVLRELCLAALQHARHPEDVASRNALTVAGELVARFVEGA